MFFATRPSPETIDRFRIASRDLPTSYQPIGVVSSIASHLLDEATYVIGHGRADFERARAALVAWEQFDLGWVELLPQPSPIAVGTVVAVLIHHLGFWSLNGCKVVYESVTNGPD